MLIFTMTSHAGAIMKAFTICTCLLLIISLVSTEANAGDAEVAVVLSTNDPSYGEALDGFQSYLSAQEVKVDYKVQYLSGKSIQADNCVREIKSHRPSLLFLLGSQAVRMCGTSMTETPTVAGFVLREEDLKPFPNTTGVYLEFPTRTQFAYLCRILPKARRVAVLYNPRENQKRVDEAASVAKRLDLELVAYEVAGPKDIPRVLKQAFSVCDVLWGLADTVVLRPETAREILLGSMRNRVPLVGVSSAWVKAGALYSLQWDYADLGRQCGQMASKVLRGEQPNVILPASPRKVGYCLNLKTARQMKLELPEEIVQGAQEVF